MPAGLRGGVDVPVDAVVAVLEAIDHHLVDDLIAPVVDVAGELDLLVEAVDQPRHRARLLAEDGPGVFQIDGRFAHERVRLKNGTLVG